MSSTPSSDIENRLQLARLRLSRRFDPNIDVMRPEARLRLRSLERRYSGSFERDDYFDDLAYRDDELEERRRSDLSPVSHFPYIWQNRGTGQDQADILTPKNLQSIGNSEEHERFLLESYASIRSPRLSTPAPVEPPERVAPVSDHIITRSMPTGQIISSGPLAPLTEAPPAVPKEGVSAESKLRNKVLDLLSSQPVELVHNDLSKMRAKGSGAWISTLPVFENWYKSPERPGGVERGGNCLLFQGNLGAGKTMLMNAAVSWLKSEVSKGLAQTQALVYYYFDRSGGCKPHDALSSLLRQICEQKDTPLPRFLSSINIGSSQVDDNSRCRSQHFNGAIGLANLLSDFLSTLARFKVVYICLDGLEQCDDVLAMLTILRRVSGFQEARLMVTGRSRIVKHCMALGVGRAETVVQLEDHNSPDIKRYVQTFLKSQKYACLSDMIGTEYQARLVEKLAKQTLPFANYACQHWGVHLNDVEDEESMQALLDNDSLLETISQILHVSSCSHTASSTQQSYDNYPTGFGGRHFGAYFGLTAAFKEWTAPEDWAVPRDSWERSPFHVCFGSPGLYNHHVLFDLLDDETFAKHVRVFDVVPLEPVAETGVEESRSNGEGVAFRYDTVWELPWKWRLDDNRNPNLNAFRDSLAGKNLRTLCNFSKDETEATDRDGKTPFHHFIEKWSEDALTGLIQVMFDRDESPESPDDEPDGASDSDNDVDDVPDSKTSLGERARLSPVTDNCGRTTLDYACERNVLCGAIPLGMTKWSPQQLANALAITASCGNVVLVEGLCEIIDDAPNPQSNESPLGKAVIEASKRGWTDVLRLLHKKGANLKIQDDGDAARFLLLEGVDPDQPDNDGRSPLYCGCESESDAIVALLREKGASTMRPNVDGQTLLHLASGRGNVSVVRRLLQLNGGALPPLLSDYGPSGQSPLHLAARQGHHAVVKVLMRGGFQIDARDGDDRTPLSHACEGGHLQSVQALLAKKRSAGVEITDTSQRTALSYAAAKGHVDIVAALVSQGGADPNVQDVGGKTALIHAAQRGHNDTVVVLIFLASNNSDTIRSLVKSTFKKLYSRYSSNPTGKIAVDLNIKDNRRKSAVNYLRKNRRHGDKKALAVIRFILEIGEKADGKVPQESSEERSHSGTLGKLNREPSTTTASEGVAYRSTQLPGFTSRNAFRNMTYVGFADGNGTTIINAQCAIRSAVPKPCKASSAEFLKESPCVRAGRGYKSRRLHQHSPSGSDEAHFEGKGRTTQAGQSRNNMSHLRYYAYEGQGVEKRKNFCYSQAVRVGDRIEVAGQGGWDPVTGVFEREINAQIDLAFANVERCVKDAGGKGWSQVFRVNSYHVPINDEALAAMVRNFRKYMPEHQPLWTCVGVTRLAEDDMRVEIEVVAHDAEEDSRLSVVSIGNSLQAYATLHFSRRVYNGRFVRNTQLPPSSATYNPEDAVNKLVPATPQTDPKATDQLTPLAGRLFGTWTLITCIVRCYAAYHLHLGPVYNIAIWTYVVALGHFASELFIFKSMTFGLPQIFPFTLASCALIWMPMVRDHYVQFN
ncbi:histidinol-phosphatase [Purpureocillium lavendulum]|uniref:Histidinol-phosphatase n=1 Tax=Purpureocillium lavendulum TaxID=1247861 RepID=A0AB34G2V3_9HYPO|nr:histidinol-phosphatase [Purpureocillium lavendulum]